MGKWYAQPICTVCGDTAVAKGLCDTHYKRQWRSVGPCSEGRTRHSWTKTGKCVECGKEKKQIRKRGGVAVATRSAYAGAATRPTTGRKEK